jgi:ribonuclease HII
MAILIGTDEAGYGPNFGPLVISATTWRVPDALIETDMYQVLGTAVEACSDPSRPGLPIGDSKLLYKLGGGLATLERSVLATASTLGIVVDTWHDVWQAFAPQSVEWRNRLPWYADFQASAPVDATPNQIKECGAQFSIALDQSEIQLLSMRSVAIFPERLNALIDRFDTKGGALSFETLKLVQQQLEAIGDERVIVHCDKHGGRNRYASVLQTVFPDILPSIVCETRQQSAYRWGPSTRRIEMRFTAKGESVLCTALASMISKYLRELAMLGFNAFWSQHVSGIRPTAGYPTDAKRFKKDIADAQERLQIEDRILWRKR